MSDAPNFQSFTDHELREEQGACVVKMRELQKEIDARDGTAKGVYTKEDDARWTTLNERHDNIVAEFASRDELRNAQIQSELRRQQLDRLENESRKRVTQPDPLVSKNTADPEKRDAEIVERVWRKWLDTKQIIHLTATEQRALQMDNDTLGGSMVASEMFVNQLIKFTDNLVWMRGLATVIPVRNAESIGVPSWDTDPADASWTSELGTGSEDTAARTGKRSLTPHPVAQRILISRTLARNSVRPVVEFVASRLAYKFGVVEEGAYLTGTGANQPLGVFTPSAQGISTGRDVSTGNTTTAVTADGLIEAKYSLKQQYMNSPALRWVFSRTAVKNIRKLKTGAGDYIWQAGLGGTPGTILDVPFLMSEYAPSTFTAGLYVGIIGDFSNYWIAESMQMEMQRLDELYAATNQIGLIGRKEVDGMPVLEEAFARVTLA
jgi:HK97 family phage major capsid protein